MLLQTVGAGSPLEHAACTPDKELDRVREVDGARLVGAARNLLCSATKGGHTLHCPTCGPRKRAFILREAENRRVRLPVPPVLVDLDATLQHGNASLRRRAPRRQVGAVKAAVRVEHGWGEGTWSYGRRVCGTQLSANVATSSLSAAPDARVISAVGVPLHATRTGWRREATYSVTGHTVHKQMDRTISQDGWLPCLSSTRAAAPPLGCRQPPHRASKIHLCARNPSKADYHV